MESLKELFDTYRDLELIRNMNCYVAEQNGNLQVGYAVTNFIDVQDVMSYWEFKAHVEEMEQKCLAITKGLLQEGKFRAARIRILEFDEDVEDDAVHEFELTSPHHQPV